MNRYELRAILDEAPSDPRERLAYIGKKTGQLFGWVTEPDQEVLVNWLPGVARAFGDAAHPAMRIVEIGTFAGSTARGLIVLTGGGSITCIDNFVDVHAGSRGDHPSGEAFWRHTLSKNGADLSEYATLIEGESRTIGATWHKPIDLLFIDGDHHEEPAYTDMAQFAPHVQAGGYCLVDDIDMPEVRNACERFFNPGSWDVVWRPAAATAKIIAYRRKS